MEGEADAAASSPRLQIDPHLDVPRALDGAGRWEVDLLQHLQHLLLLVVQRHVSVSSAVQ